MKEYSLSHPDNKALDLGAIRALVERTKDMPPSHPVFMSTDEEGNSFGKLWQIDVTKEGLVLWPADEGNTPFDY